MDDFWTKLSTLNFARWDDPLHDGASGPEVREVAIPRFARWVKDRVTEIQHLRTTSDSKRVVVEHVLTVKDGLVWNPTEQRGERTERIELATAVVRQADAVRVYFGTWSVLDGKPRMRVGPIAPDERAETAKAMDAMPVIRRYFDGLAAGDPTIVDLFEPDGYFREPANNFMCGRDQLLPHFRHILDGGVGIEFLTATREGERLGLELQTVKWGPKTMPKPQAGFAIYELGPHGKLQGARVYDSVVPP